MKKVWTIQTNITYLSRIRHRLRRRKKTSWKLLSLPEYSRGHRTLKYWDTSPCEYRSLSLNSLFTQGTGSAVPHPWSPSDWPRSRWERLPGVRALQVFNHTGSTVPSLLRMSCTIVLARTLSCTELYDPFNPDSIDWDQSRWSPPLVTGKIFSGYLLGNPCPQFNFGFHSSH